MEKINSISMTIDGHVVDHRKILKVSIKEVPERNFACTVRLNRLTPKEIEAFLRGNIKNERNKCKDVEIVATSLPTRKSKRLMKQSKLFLCSFIFCIYHNQKIKIYLRRTGEIV